MNEIKIRYRFIVFLYAYLNQIDLSLDRSRWTSLEALGTYYKTQISPGEVANYLLQISGLSNANLKYLYFVETPSFWTKIRYQLIRIFQKDSFLKESEIYYCCQKLLSLDEYLTANQEFNKLEFERLRIELAKLNFGIIKYKVSSKDQKKAMMVEHYLQNENLHVVKMEEFVKGFKL